MSSMPKVLKALTKALKVLTKVLKVLTKVLKRPRTYLIQKCLNQGDLELIR